MGSDAYQIEFTNLAIEHLQFWQKSDQQIFLPKIEQLIESIQNTPTEGIGKPEMLNHELAGQYSRRINKEHRLIYKIENKTIFIL